VKDIFRKMVSLTIRQVSRAYKYAHVSTKGVTKRYGYKALDTVFKKFAQLDNKSIFDPRYAEISTSIEKYDVLHLLTMVKEKHDGKVNGRGRVDRRKQRIYIAKEDVVPSTVQLERLILSLLIDAYEGRDVVILDVVWDIPIG